MKTMENRVRALEHGTTFADRRDLIAVLNVRPSYEPFRLSTLLRDTPSRGRRKLEY